MTTIDAVVLDFLTAHARFTPHQVAHVEAWWRTGRSLTEDLPGFLFRQELISEPTWQIFRRVAEGHLNRIMGFVLVDRAEIDAFRRRLPDIMPEQESLTHTVTLLAAQETTRETRRQSPEVPPRVGGMLGKYLLTDWVGQGASGSVFRALHPTLHIPVAIKVLHPESANDQSDRVERFQDEARLLAMLNHPNIVRLYDFEAHPRYPYLVLEHVNGPSLAELIEQCGRLRPDRALRIARQAGEALASAHRAGILHRDVKPANLLLTRAGEVKLADLGFAAMASDAGTRESRAGTAHYVAPEMIRHPEAVDVRSDVYSLGATLFHMLAGQPPYRGESLWTVLEAQVAAPVPDVREFSPEVPAAVAATVSQMLAKDPADRPASMESLLLALAPLAQERSESRPTDSSSSFWRRMPDKMRKRELAGQPG